MVGDEKVLSYVTQRTEVGDGATGEVAAKKREFLCRSKEKKIRR